MIDLYRYLGEWVNEMNPTELEKCLLIANTKITIERELGRVIPRPAHPDLFRCFRATPPDKVKVIIPVLEPVHNDEAFNGIGYGSNTNQSPSLTNLLKELERTHGEHKISKDLHEWTKRGVLLPYIAYTTRATSVGAHIEIWEPFQKMIMDVLNKKDGLVWIMMGSYTTQMEKLITNETHYVLPFTHPSPLNTRQSILGSDLFLSCDEKTTIKWT